MSKHSKLTAVFSGLLVLIVAVSAIMLPGCEEEGEIKIGVILPLTGPSANHGEEAMNAIELVLEQMGKENIKVRLIYEDTKAQPEQGVSAFRKLIDVDEVPIVLGPISSSVMLACAPIAEERGVVLISPAASSPAITQAGDYIFRTSLLAPLQGERMALYCQNDLGATRVAILYLNTETGLGYRDAFKEAFQKRGGEITIEETYEQEASDFRTSLVKINDTNPDAIYIAGTPNTTGLILRQAKELGIEGPFLANIGVEGQDLLDIAGEDAEGLVYTSTPEVDPDFVKAYEEKFGRTPTIAAPLTYDAFRIVLLALEKGGNNPDKIKDALYKIQDFQGVMGKLSFDENGDVIREVALKTVINGRFVYLE